MELQHLPDMTTTDRVPVCEICRERPVRVVTWKDCRLVTPLCDQCNAEEEATARAARLARQGDRSRKLDHDLGERYAAYSFESFPVVDAVREAAVERVRSAALDDVLGRRRNLVLFGSVGAGKTSLAVSAAKLLVERGMAARFFVVRDWLDLVRASFDEPNDADSIAKTTELLVFDDLGAERTTPFALEKLLGVIDHRYRNKRPIIVTSNFAPSELVEQLHQADPRIGQRIVSRLMEDTEAVRLEASDLRIAERAAA